jgi:hypothetical protein
MANPKPLSIDMTCTKEDCTNRRSNAGYGRYRTVCEKHRHERFGMDYQKGSKAAKTKTQQFREDLLALSTIAHKQGAQGVVDKIEELLTNRYN